MFSVGVRVDAVENVVVVPLNLNQWLLDCTGRYTH